MLALLKTAQKPEGLSDDLELQPHQAEALEHAKDKPGVILNHGLGSGKTVTGIAIGEQEGGNTLAVTPASLTSNYEKEVDQFVKPERRDAHRAVSYSKFRRDPDRYIDEHQPDTMILDEMHRLRNPTKAREAVDHVRPRVGKTVGMTASMVNNHPKETAPLVNTVAGEKVIGEDEFEREFIDKQKPGVLGRILGGEESEKIKNKDKINETLGPYVHRYEPDKSGPDYPDAKTEEVDVPMSKKQKQLIKGVEKKNPLLAYKVRNNLPPSKQEAKQLNAFMQAHRQISNTPATHDDSIDDPIADSPKMQKVLEDMEGVDRGVVYSNYLDGGAKPVIDNAENAELYHGGLSQKQRDEMLERFENGETNVLGLSPAGAEGIDLKGVRRMAIMDPDWNPETTNQAVGRAVRYKSHEHLPEDERNVEVKKYRSTYPDRLHHKITGRPQSPDEYLDEVQKEKQQLNEEFLESFE